LHPKGKTVKNIIQVENLNVEVHRSAHSVIRLLKGVEFSVPEGKVTAIVGESGSGKTLTGLSIMGLLPSEVSLGSENGRIIFHGENILHLAEKELRLLRGKAISMIFQDAGASLNPVITVGEQIAQPLMEHFGLSKRQAWNRAVELLDEVGIPFPALRAKAFPHQLSGGQQQRVMIAAAVACKPKLLIADEPTSSLDVTVQRQILDLLLNMREQLGMTLLFISHDLAVVSEIADFVVVMCKGKVREEGARDDVLFSPRDSYSRALIDSRFHMVHSQATELKNSRSREVFFPAVPVVLEVFNLSKDYQIRTAFRKKKTLNVVKGVSFKLYKGETLGIVGESGSGKTTLAKMLVRLINASGGTFLLSGDEVSKIPLSAFRPLRQRIQIVFQNPYASLNPRWTIGRTLDEPMQLHSLDGNKIERTKRAAWLLERVGLSGTDLGKYPHQFSGGERQRIAIARCLTVNPDIIICDECVSALDATVQVQVLDLLRELQQELGLSYLFISHDLAVIRFIADRVLVFQQGEIVEEGLVCDVFTAPAHPYTRLLLSSTPHINK